MSANSNNVAAAHRDARRKLVREGKLRSPMTMGERSRVIAAMLIWFVAAVAVKTANNRAMPLHDAISETARQYSWMRYAILGEIARQLLIYMREVSVGYHTFWVKAFDTVRAARQSFSEPVRYNATRAVNLLVGYTIAGIVIGTFTDTPWVTAVPTLLARLADGGTLRSILVYSLYFAFNGLLLFAMAGGRVELIKPDEIKTSFDDVWGQDAVLDRVRETVTYLEQPELIEQRGGYVPGGILLYGPPGTGKTLMAEAIAGETGRPFVLIDPAAFKATFVGIAPMKMRLLFRKLRRLSQRYGGVVAFFDEADDLGNRGGGVSQHSGAGQLNAEPDPAAGGVGTKGIVITGDGSGVLQAMLAQMSGLKKPRRNAWRFLRSALNMKAAAPPQYRILIVMATNRPDSLDAAMLRPGRLDRHFRVGYPDLEGRRRTFAGYLAKVPHELTDHQIDQLAASTPRTTGAVIKDMVNEALIGASRNARTSITWADMTKAVRDKLWGVPVGGEYNSRMRHSVAVHEASHAVATWLLRPSQKIEVATIEETGRFLGAVGYRDRDGEDGRISWASDLEGDIAVSLASLAGERHFYGGDSGSGVAGDIQSATETAMRMEGDYAMGATLASRATLGARVAEDGQFEARVEARLRRCYTRAEQAIQQHEHRVLALAHALEIHRTLIGEDVVAVLEGQRTETVDGTVYHSAHAQQQLAQWHQGIVGVHQRHSDLMPPLPDLAGPTLSS